jgi:hypothetical protein
VVKVATTGVTVRRRRPATSHVDGHRGRRRAVGRLRGPRRRQRVGRRRGALRHPRRGRLHPHPERRRLRPGGRRDHRQPSASGTAPQGRAAPSAPRECGFGYRTAGSRPTRRGTSSSTSPSSSAAASLGAPVKYAELARTLGVEPGERAPLPTYGMRCSAAFGQGHGARRERPRHLERRLVLHEPALTPSSPTRCPRAPRAGRSRTAP